MDIHAALNTNNQSRKNAAQSRGQAASAFHDMLAQKSKTLPTAKSIQAAEAALKDQKAQKKKVNDIQAGLVEEVSEDDIIDIAVKRIEKKLSTLAELERRGRGL